METILQELKEKKEQYVKEKADAIIESMIKNKWTDYQVSTCDHSNWDVEYHRTFPRIAEELRKRGLNVARSVKWGVTDWDISV